VRGNRASAAALHTGTIAAEGLTEIRVSNIPRVTITGEPRNDIAYEFTVESMGPDEAAARGEAEASSLREDHVGAAVSLSPTFSGEDRHTATLTLRMPARLAAHVEGGTGGGRIEVTHVAALELASTIGDARVVGVAGPVTGNHRNGRLAVNDAGSVNLTVGSVDLDVADIHGPVTVVLRNGRGQIARVAGPLDIDETSADVTVTDAGGPARISAASGHVTLQQPAKESRIDARRADISITLDRSVPLTVFTTDSPLHVFLADSLDLALDAVGTDGGSVVATDFGLAPVARDQESRLTHTFGRGTAHVALRNQRGEIVIGQRK